MRALHSVRELFSFFMIFILYGSGVCVVTTSEDGTWLLGIWIIWNGKV